MPVTIGVAFAGATVSALAASGAGVANASSARPIKQETLFIILPDSVSAARVRHQPPVESQRSASGTLSRSNRYRA